MSAWWNDPTARSPTRVRWWWTEPAGSCATSTTSPPSSPTPSAEVAGETRIGVIGTTARWLMPQMLTRLGVEYPDVHPIVFEGSTSALVPRLVSGQIDGAIVHLPVDEPELQVEPLFAEDLMVVVPANHHLADRDVMSLRALTGEPLLLPPKSAVLRQMIDRAAAAVGVTLHAQAEIDGVRLLASLAFEGFGAAIVPATATPSWLRGNFHRIAVPELPRRVVGWTHSGPHGRGRSVSSYGAAATAATPHPHRSPFTRPTRERCPGPRFAPCRSEGGVLWVWSASAINGGSRDRDSGGLISGRHRPTRRHQGW